MAHVFKLPDLGEGIHEAEIQELFVSVGDEVKEGEDILLVETDKAAVEVPSPFTGTVQEIAVEPGDIVNVGDQIMTFGNGAKSSKESEADEAEAPVKEETVAEQGTNRDERAASRKKADTEITREGPVPASPATRRLARELEVDLQQVTGSGPGGRVTSADVQAFAEEGPKKASTGAEQPFLEEDAEEDRDKKAEAETWQSVEVPSLPDFSHWGEVRREPLRSVRRTTAKKMAQAWSHIPHVSHEDIADITELEQLRQAYKKEMETNSLSLTVFVMKAAVAALKTFPRFNASLDMKAEEIILKQYYHLGTAVDTERGLIVPVIREVDRKSIHELSNDLQDLVERTRAGETSLEEMQGGTFTITNVGIIGGVRFAPLINFPQVAILGMAKAAWQPAVIDKEGERVVEPRFKLRLILTFDHRVVDGADAARFMRQIVETLEDPNKLMLEV